VAILEFTMGMFSISIMKINVSHCSRGSASIDRIFILVISEDTAKEAAVLSGQISTAEESCNHVSNALEADRNISLHMSTISNDIEDLSRILESVQSLLRHDTSIGDMTWSASENGLGESLDTCLSVLQDVKARVAEPGTPLEEEGENADKREVEEKFSKNQVANLGERLKSCKMKLSISMAMANMYTIP
jgi:hypothetical protein